MPWLRCHAGRIVEAGVIGAEGGELPDSSGAVPPGDGPSGEFIDGRDVLLAPGFVDLQVNGVDDVDFARATPDQFVRAGRMLAAHGVTAYCPTVCTAPLDAYPRMLAALAAARAAAAGRAGFPEILGVHLEGPFLGAAPGAHPVELVRPVELGWLHELLDAFPGLIRIVTLAPEADRDFAGIRLLRERGAVVALGHSRASYDLARSAVEAGASMVTHLFNGMGPLHHREPGLAGAALDDDRLTPTLIADLVHVHPAALRLAIGRKPNVALVTDAVAVNGTATVARDGAAYVAGTDTLAGSVLHLDTAVRNVVGLGVPVARAAEMAATVPAAGLGLADRGRLEAGARADVVALDPETGALRAVWIGGEPVGR